MPNNGTINKTIKVTGVGDFSNVLNALKNLRSQVEKNASLTDILNIDKTFSKIGELLAKILLALQNGLSDPKNLKEYNKSVESIAKLTNDLNAKFLSLHITGLDKEIENVKQLLKQSEETYKQMVKTQLLFIAELLEGVLNSKSYAKTIVDAAKDGKSLKDVLEEITSELDKQIEKLKELKSAAEQNLSLAIAREQDTAKRDELSLSLTYSNKLKKRSFRKTEESGGGDISDEEYTSIKEAYAKAVQESKSASAALTKFTKLIAELGVELKNASTAETAFDKSYDIIDTNRKEINLSKSYYKRQISTASTKITAAEDTKTKIEVAVNSQEVNKAFDSITNSVNKVKLAEQQLGDTVNNVLNNKMLPGLEELTSALEAYVQDLRAAGQTAQDNLNLLNTLEQTKDQILSIVKDILSLTTAWRTVKQVVVLTFNDTKNLDKAFAEIAMVTKYSVEDMWATYGDYVEMAEELGQTTEGVIKASGLFYQQGLDTAEALLLTESTMKLATLAGLDFKEATSEMTAAIRGFHMEMDLGEHITDVYSQLAAHAAADVLGIAEAITKTASIANSAGMAFETTSAFLTQMIETTQEAPANLGTAMKTIIARFTELKNNVAGTSDSEFEDLDYNKVDTALKSVGVALKDTTGLFRNLDDVFLELSAKWNDLDRNTQRYIATTAAGSRLQSRFIAMMENYERTMELVETAQNAAGKSGLQFAKYQDTIEYKVNLLKTSWEALRFSFINSDFFKGAIDLLNLVVKNITLIAENKPLLIASFTAFGIALKTVLTGIVTDIYNTIKRILDSSKLLVLTDDTQLKLILFLLERIRELINEINGKKVDVDVNTGNTPNTNSNGKNNTPDSEKGGFIKTLKLSGVSFGQTFASAFSSGMIGYLSSNDAGGAFVGTITTGLLTSLPSLISGFSHGLTAGLINAGVTIGATLIAGATAALAKFIKEQEELRDLNVQLEKTKSELEDIESAANKTREELQNLTDEKDNVEDLTKEYEKLSNLLITTDEEKERLNEVVNELIENYPEILSNYDLENNKLTINNELLRERVELLEREADLERGKLVLQEAEKFIKTHEKQTKLAYSDLGSLLGIDFNAKTINENDFVLSILSGNLEAITGANGLFDYSIMFDYATGGTGKHWVDKDASKATEEFIAARDEAYALIKDLLYRIYNDKGYLLNLSEQLLSTLKNVVSYTLGDTLKDFNLNDIIEDTDTIDYINNIRQEILSILKDVLGSFGETYQFVKTEVDLLYKDLSDEEKSALTTYLTSLIPNLSDVNITDITKEILQSRNFSKIAKEIANEYDLLPVKDKIINEYQTLYEAIAEGVWDSRTYAEALKEANDKEVGSLFEELYPNEEEYEKAFGEGSASNKEASEKIAEKFLNRIVTENLKNYSIDENVLKELIDFKNNLSTLTLKEIAELFLHFTGTKTGELGISLEALQSFLGISLEDINTAFGLVGDFEEITYNTAKSIQIFKETVKEELGDIDNADKIANTYVNNVLGALQDANIDEEQWGAFFSDIHWDLLQTPKDIAKFLQDLITNFKSIGITIDTELIGKLLKFAEEAKLTDLTLSTRGEIEDFTNTLIEGAKEFSLYEDTFIDIIGTLGITGQISTKQYQELVEILEELGLNIEDYVEIGADGTITANQNALLEVYKSLTLALKDLLLVLRDLNEAKLQELLAQVALYTGKILLQFLGKATQLQIFSSLPSELLTLITATQEAIDTIDEALAKYSNLDAMYAKSWENNYNDYIKNGLADLSDLENDVTDAIKERDEAEQKISDTLKDVADALQEVNEKLKDYKEALYGTEFHKNLLDGLYNYTTNLQRLTDNANEAKESLQDLADSDDITELIDSYLSNIHGESVSLLALNQVLEAAIRNYLNVLNTRLSEEISNLNRKYGSNISVNMADFYYKTGDRWNINFLALNAANIPDEVSDYVELTVEELNKLEDSIKDNAKTLKDREKEIKEIRKNAVLALITLENEVVRVLKEKYQEEISNLEDKYKAMKEADDDYISSLETAIEKQRKLRDKEEKWEDLAQKQKQYSLMRRDTSGSNKIETKKLAKDIQKTLRDLLDSAVDDIIENLKELYELLAETRDSEIEYLNALLENSNLIAEANTIIANWGSADDAVNWFYNNVADLSEMSEALLEQEKLSWIDMYNNHILYLETTQLDFSDALETTAEEISQTVMDTSEAITSEAERSLGALTESVDEAISSAAKSLADAEAKLAEALRAHTVAIQDHENAVNKLTDALLKYAEAAKNMYGILTIFEKYLDKETSRSEIAETLGMDSNASNSELTDVLKKFGLHGYFSAESVFLTNKDLNWVQKVKGAMLSGPSLLSGSGISMFKKGGIVDYTGPAWVDGTPRLPEAFLNSEDTKRIGAAARLLSEIPFLKGDNINNAKNISTVGDTTIEVNITIDNISSDYDVDLAVERIKQDIVEAAKYKGSNVILKK